MSGTFNCDTTETGKPGDSWEVEVSVVQLSTVTEALGNTYGKCEGGLQTFVINAVVDEGRPALEEEPAIACAFFVSGRGKRKITGLRQWCGAITLVKELP